MSEKFNDFENVENKRKKGSDNQLRILKIFAIIFILILSVAISGYLVYSYFQTNKINFNENREKVLSENIPSTTNENNIDINQEDTTKKDESSNENTTSKLVTQKNTPSVLVKPEISTSPKPSSNQSQATTTKTNQTQNTTNTSQNQTSTNTNTKENTTKKQTKTTTSSSTTKSSVSYIIQIASFTDFDKAISLKNKLEKEGIICYIVIADIQGKYYYRVRCGKFSTKKEAEDIIKKIISIDRSLSPIILQN